MSSVKNNLKIQSLVDSDILNDIMSNMQHDLSCDVDLCQINEYSYSYITDVLDYYSSSIIDNINSLMELSVCKIWKN